MRTGISHRLRRFSQIISAYPRAYARGRARILPNREEHEFELQNRCLRMRVCARSRAAGTSL